MKRKTALVKTGAVLFRTMLDHYMRAREIRLPRHRFNDGRRPREAESRQRRAAVRIVSVAEEVQGRVRTHRPQDPANFVIDRHGVVRYAVVGGLTLKALDEILVPLLAEPPTK